MKGRKKTTSKKEVKSKTNLHTIFTLIIGGIIVSLLGVNLLSKSDGETFFLMLGVGFLLLGIFSIYWVFNYDVLFVSKGELTFKSLTGFTKKTILLSEFKSYTEIEKENAKRKYETGYMKWKDLTLIGEKTRYTISSISYDNYDELKNKLIRGLKYDRKADKKWRNNNLTLWAVGFVIFGVFVVYLSFKFTEADTSVLLFARCFSFTLVCYGVYLFSKRKK